MRRPRSHHAPPRGAAARAAHESRGAGAARWGGLAQIVALARGAGNAALARLLGRPGSGVPLDPARAARYGRAYGVPLDGVRVVDDAGAHEAATALGATAFAAGGAVHLGRDAPPLGTPAGERLLAHELAHLSQQARAGAARGPLVGAAGDAHERAADSAAGAALHGQIAPVAAAGAPAAVQRQAKERPPMSRADAQAELQAYFERVLAQQGGKAVSMTADVKGTLRRIFLNDVSGMLRFDAFIGGTVFPGSPAALAEAVARYLPDAIDPARLAHLRAPGAAKSKEERVGELVAKTAPAVTDEQQEAQWRFDQAAKDLRRDEDVVGPFGLDVLRAARIASGLPGAIAGPKGTAPPPKPVPAVEAVAEAAERDLLIPAAARGTPKADEFADASAVARAVGADLDRAHAAKQETVALRLGANYNGAKDRVAMADAAAALVKRVRDALPHKAAAVRYVDVYFGEMLVRRVVLGEGAGGGPAR